MTSGEVSVWVSLAFAGFTIVWNIVEWNRTGPRLRVHALLYRDVLLVWVFNAGRGSVQIEKVVIGGRRGGIGGVDLTDQFGAPVTLAPGESRRRVLGRHTLVPFDRQSALSGGFESVWLLLGSMQQRRSEILPIPASQPPSVGWRLAPRFSNLTRFSPLAMSVPLALVSLWPSAQATPGLLVAMGLAFGLRFLLTPGYRAARRRLERSYEVVAFMLFLGLWFARSDWLASGYPLVIYLLGAILLAVPGAVPAAYRGGRVALSRAKELRIKSDAGSAAAGPRRVVARQLPLESRDELHATRRPPEKAEDGAKRRPQAAAPAEPAP